MLPPELLERITDPRERDLPGLDPARDYGLEPNVRLTEAAARSWEHAKAYWGAFKARLEGSRPGAELGVTRQQWLLPLLAELDYDDLGYRPQAEEVNGRPFHISHRATSEATAPPLHLVAASQPLDKADPSAPGQKASPHGFLQSYLNETDHLWGIVSNGRQLRILRDNASLTRPAYLEFDLEGMMEGGVFADFTLLWLVAHRSRLPKGTSDTDACFLEQWYKAALVRGARALGDLRLGVENAIRALGQGFLDHPENEALREKLAAGDLDDVGYYRQLLRVVYRLLFLLVAEERDLLFPRDREEEPQAQKDVRARGREIYNDHYSVSRLRERLRLDRGDNRHDDLWRAQRVAFDLLRAGNPNLGLPALGGGIFDTRMCPDLEAAQLRNDALKGAARGLSLAPTKFGYRRINYRDLDVEELGSVYESLLDEQPSLRADGSRAQFTLASGGERKSTGSYYTPSVLVQELIRSALDPVIQQALESAPDIEGKRRALLDLAVCDPACGSGHFLLAAARRIGRELARLASGEHEPDPAVLRHSIREAITHCVYGVDLNPLAVDLCRLALWLEGHEPGRPLGFLDHHIKCGNSLVGATTELIEKGIPTEAFEPVEGDSKDVAKEVKKQNRQELEKPQLRLFESTGLEPAGPSAAEAKEARAIAEFEEDAPEDVLLKEEEYGEFAAKLAHKKRAADLWTAAFFWPLHDESPAPPTQSTLLHHRAGREQEMGNAFERQLARMLEEVRPFHWELEFPDVFDDRKGGFDCMLGNPPWDTLSPDVKEFFAVYEPSIRFADATEQRRIQAALLADEPIAHRWDNYCRLLYQNAHFLKNSGRFLLFAPGNLGKGDFNIFRMFVENHLCLTRLGGATGQVVPEGLSNGANSMALRERLFAHWTLSRLFGFENSAEVWFKDIDSRTKFCLYSAFRTEHTDSFLSAFNIRSVEQLQRANADEALRIPVPLVREFSPDALAIMEFGSQREIDIVAKMYAAWPKFGDESAGEPIRHYMREVDMGNDRDLFSGDSGGLPVYEGRMVGQYDHRAKGYRGGRGRSADWEDFEFGHPRKRIQPQWYVAVGQVPDKARERVGRFRAAWCNVTSPTNERTLVASLIPNGTVCGHSLQTMTFSGKFEFGYVPWLAVANSYAMDYLVRKKTSINLTLTVMDSLPFPRYRSPELVSPRLAELVLRLTCAGPEMASYWNEMSVYGWVPTVPDGAEPLGFSDPEERLVARAELDAIVARDVFSLSREDMDLILESFSTAAKYERQRYGAFRSRDLILGMMS
ncbi:MAG: N-6 DNA methylase [Chloroflexi bacterium]|nr:N-6 DNA methylase [Chloroflexota bacterium]